MAVPPHCEAREPYSGVRNRAAPTVRGDLVRHRQGTLDPQDTIAPGDAPPTMLCGRGASWPGTLSWVRCCGQTAGSCCRTGSSVVVDRELGGVRRGFHAMGKRRALQGDNDEVFGRDAAACGYRGQAQEQVM